MRPMKLRTKLILLIFGLFFTVMTMVGGLFNNIIGETLEDQIGKRALNVSKTVASMPTIVEAFDSPNPSAIIQPIAEEVRITTGAEFVVVGNREGIRYSHPVPERIGRRMVGGDNRPALEEGKSYVSRAIGTLGPSLRGKVPIMNPQGEIIGIVSVGFMIEDIEETVEKYQKRVILLILLGFLLGGIGAVWISSNVKQAIFGLEPNQIAQLFKEKNAILHSIREGIIAINEHGLVTTANQAALDILGKSRKESIIGQPITHILPQTKMLEVIETRTSQIDQEIQIGDSIVIANRIPIFHGDKVIGVVSSFRRKEEIDQLARELTQVQTYADSLRAQSHEYSNKLYTISGLIQFGNYNEALELISQETSGYYELEQFLSINIADPMLQAFLLGKHNRGRELKVDLQIDQQSSLGDLPEHVEREKLVTILGNLLDNAFEAVIQNEPNNREVRLFMTDIGKDIIFEIEDSGPGLSSEEYSSIFEKGYSTKQGNGRGVGLYLVKNALQYLGGYITVSQSPLQGAAFTVVIPKEGLKSK